MAQRVVVAPDGFGSTLSAARAAAAIGRGWSSARPGDEVIGKPQSDGGPGFLDCLADVGEERSAVVRSPLGESVSARWRVDGGTAYLECAQACGLHLVATPDPLTAVAAKSAGVGDLIAAALVEPGVRRLVVGLGGSATTDGGRGMLDALGGGTSAARLLSGIDVVAATDVDNPLTGPRGAAQVFAPQKGADPAAVEELAARLRRYGADLDGLAGRPVSAEPGAGAAGGIGAALLAVGARRVSGAGLVAEATGLPAAVREADLVITGEGRLDEQTAGGKVVAGVAALATGIPVLALVGECALADPRSLGLTAAHSLIDHVGRDRALGDAESALESMAARVSADWRDPRE
ncbi:glycerate kinase [Gordonia sp. (in: high G+C Gram-positive bacteria)]|uniref:glycerate kinase family protein n=1 Tax=Gordonia sp. (in: high G+C Gram-positive bacteria) TaxID=84139 RepID=UPI0039E315B3